MRIYLETSVISGLLDKDEPKFPKFSRLLFKKIRQNAHEGFVSDLVMGEILNAPADKKFILEGEVSNLNLTILRIDSDALALAQKYLNSKIIPHRYKSDAIHIAVATTNHLEILASWNLSHIVRPKTISGVNSINKLEGYPGIRIETPQKVITG